MKLKSVKENTWDKTECGTYVERFLLVYMERCLKFKREMDATLAPSLEVFQDMHKKAKQTKITSFFTKSDDPKSGSPTSSQ